MTRSFQQVSSFLGGEVSPRLRSRTGSERYQNGCEQIENFIVLAHGGAERRQGLQHVGLIGEESIVIAMRQESNDLTVVVSEARVEVFDGEFSQGIVAVSPYSGVDLDTLQWSQDEQSLEIVCDTVRPHQLKLVNNVWVFEPTQYDQIPQHAFGDSQSPAGEDETVTITFGGAWVNGESFSLLIDGIETNQISYIDEDEVLASRISGELRRFTYDDVWGGDFSTIEVTGTGPFFVTRIGVASATPILLSVGAVNSTSGTLDVGLGTVSPSSSGGVEDAWSDARGWPRTVVHHDQRKIYGGTRSLAATVWGSRTGVEGDFTIGQNDSDPFSFRLKSQKPMEIRWLASKRLLAIGTTGGDIVQFARPLTPTSVQFDRQTGHQSAGILPVEANSETFYVIRGGRKIYTLLYEEQSQGWRSIDATFPSEHITEGEIRQIDYSDQPDGIVWCVLKSGELAAMTYERTQEVVAWHRHKFAGTFRSVAVVHRDNVDQVWFVIEEDDAWRVCRLPVTSTSKPENFGWLDLWIKSVNTPAARSFSGLINHEGRTVRVMADGQDVGYHVVQNGVITLDDEAEEIYAGFDYTGFIRTNAYEGGAFGSSQVPKRRWSNLIARMIKSVMPLINGERPDDREGDTVMDQAEPFFTGDLPVEGTDYESGGRIEITADLPGPCHVTGLFGVMSVGQG